MAIYTSIDQLVGNTPLIDVTKAFGTGGRILAKVEYFNPIGSVKDRIAVAMLDDAERSGLLAPGATIIEPTKRQYRYRIGGDCGITRLQDGAHHARDHVD